MDLQKQSKKLLYETLSKQLPESSISEDQIKRARWKWEFLRLNKNYIEKCLALKVKTFLILPQHNEFKISSWINPKLSFDEILQIVRDDLKGVKVDDKDKAIRIFTLLVFGMLLHPAVGIIGEHDNTIGLQINLNAPDSQIKKEVAEILKTRRAAIGKGRQFKTLAEYHRAFSLHQAGKTYYEIQSIMAQDENMPDVREVNVSRLMREARKLIDGGYRNI
jgi:hypothetical protein